MDVRALCEIYCMRLYVFLFVFVCVCVCFCCIHVRCGVCDVLCVVVWFVCLCLCVRVFVRVMLNALCVACL